MSGADEKKSAKEGPALEKVPPAAASAADVADAADVKELSRIAWKKMVLGRNDAPPGDSLQEEMLKWGILVSRHQRGCLDVYKKDDKHELSATLLAQAMKFASAAVTKLKAKTPHTQLMNAEYEALGGKYGKPLPTLHTQKERAFLEGAMRRADAKVFVAVFNATTNMVAFERNGYIPLSLGHSSQPGPLAGQMPDGWLPELDLYHFGCNCGSKAGTACDCYTDELAPLVGGVSAGELTQLNFVVCVDPVWGRGAREPGGLYEKALAAAELTDIIMGASNTEEAARLVDAFLNKAPAPTSESAAPAAAPAASAVPAAPDSPSSRAYKPDAGDTKL